jgi:hypothetical protein
MAEAVTGRVAGRRERGGHLAQSVSVAIFHDFPNGGFETAPEADRRHRPHIAWLNASIAPSDDQRRGTPPREKLVGFEVRDKNKEENAREAFSALDFVTKYYESVLAHHQPLGASYVRNGLRVRGASRPSPRTFGGTA